MLIDLLTYPFQLCLVALNRVRSSGLALSGNPIDWLRGYPCIMGNPHIETYHMTPHVIADVRIICCTRWSMAMSLSIHFWISRWMIWSSVEENPKYIWEERWVCARICQIILFDANGKYDPGVLIPYNQYNVHWNMYSRLSTKLLLAKSSPKAYLLDLHQ